MNEQRWRLVSGVGVVYGVVVVVLSVIHWLVPQRDDALALTAIFEAYLYVPLVLLLPFAARHRSTGLMVVLCVSAVLFALRFGPTLISPPSSFVFDGNTDEATTFSALTWNLRSDNDQISEIMEVLIAKPAGIVALQELTGAESAAIANAPTLAQLYPYQILNPEPGRQGRPGTEGMALLSQYPILEHELHTAPAAIRARLDIGRGRELTVINATPDRARIQLPTYDPGLRDSQIRRLRESIEPLLEQGVPLLVLGDFNVTSREPAYEELTAGLQDAHLEVGLGFGNTWRHRIVGRLPFGLLRIDYLFSSPGVQPLMTDVDCAPHKSDHCIVRGQFSMGTD